MNSLALPLSISRIARLGVTTAAVTLMLSAGTEATARSDMFHAGKHAYNGGDPAGASELWSKSAQLEPAAGTLQNLGLAEWQRGRRAAAILAWEQAVWVDPFNVAAQENLRFARQAASLEAPEYSWCEAASMWLPVNVWALVAAGSFWFAVAMVLLARVLRWRRSTWHQACAAAGFTLFLVCLPALYGIHTRARIGFVMTKETPLRLTPTRDAQTIMLLPEGQPVRCGRMRGGYGFVRTRSGNGWIEREQIGRVCPD